MWTWGISAVHSEEEQCTVFKSYLWVVMKKLQVGPWAPDDLTRTFYLSASTAAQSSVCQWDR